MEDDAREGTTLPTEPVYFLRRFRDQPRALLGRFELVRQLGEGAMGVVFEARDTQRGSLIALKAMKAPHAGLLYRIKNEFRAIADVRHPNLVRLYELHNVDGLCFFTMERIEGVPINDWARPRGGGFDEQRLRAAFAQLCSGISAIHAAGKVHRDLKPSNVLVTNSGRVVILDFGLASDPRPGRTASTRESGIVGTPAYMAPEQKAGAGSSPASDWYAVGVMLYEVLTGERRTPDGPSPSSLVSSIPSELNALCQQLLATDAQHRPGPDDIARVLPAPVSPARAKSSLRPFVGRDHELAMLREALRDTDDGKPVAAWVSGLSGIGKTALVEHFAALAAPPARVLFGRCHEREAVPYNALDGLIDQLCRELRGMQAAEIAAVLPRDAAMLAQVFPVLLRIRAFSESMREVAPTPLGPGLRRRAIVALKELLRRLALSRPLVIVIDDMHWGDIDSANLLGELLRPPDAPAMLVIGCYRSEEAKHATFVQRVLPTVAEAGLKVVHIQVGALCPREGEQLVCALLEQGPGEIAAELAREAAGVPFLIGELVAYQQVSKVSGVPPDLAGVLSARLGRLPVAACRLLELIAVAVRPLRVPVARTLVSSFDDALDALCSAKLVRIHSDGSIWAYHDRIRMHVVRSLSQEASRASHRLLAEALGQLVELDHEALSAHWWEAGEKGLAAQHAKLAAHRAAEQLAFDRAADLYGIALQGSDAAEHGSLLVCRADALSNSGSGRQAAECYLEAAAVATNAEQLTLRARAAEAYLTSGNVEEGMAVVRPLLKAVRLRLPDDSTISTGLAFLDHVWIRTFGVEPRRTVASQSELSRIDVCLSVAIGALCVDDASAFMLALRGLRLAIRAGHVFAVARSLPLYACFVRSTNADARQTAAAYFKIARRLATGLHNAPLSLWIDAADAMSEVAGGDWNAALDKVERVESSSAQAHLAGFGLATAHHAMRVTLAFRGEMLRLEACAVDHMHDAALRGDFWDATGAMVLKAWTRIAADDAESALSELDSLVETWSSRVALDESGGTSISATEAYALFVRLYARLYREQPDLALRDLESTWTRIEAGRILWHHGWSVAFHLMKGCVLVACLGGAESVRIERALVECIKVLRKRPIPRWSTAASDMLEAGLLWSRGERRFAAELLQKAADGFEAEAMFLHAAACRRRWGEIVGGAAGQQSVASADRRMFELGVKKPKRWSRAYSPGFGARWPNPGSSHSET